MHPRFHEIFNHYQFQTKLAKDIGEKHEHDLYRAQGKIKTIFPRINQRDLVRQQLETMKVMHWPVVGSTEGWLRSRRAKDFMRIQIGWQRKFCNRVSSSYHPHISSYDHTSLEMDLLVQRSRFQQSAANAIHTRDTTRSFIESKRRERLRPRRVFPSNPHNSWWDISRHGVSCWHEKILTTDGRDSTSFDRIAPSPEHTEMILSLLRRDQCFGRWVQWVREKLLMAISIAISRCVQDRD